MLTVVALRRRRLRCLGAASPGSVRITYVYVELGAVCWLPRVWIGRSASPEPTDKAKRRSGNSHRSAAVDVTTERGLVSRRLGVVSALLSLGAHKTNFIEQEIQGLAQVVGDGDVCIDIGAEYGLYAMAFATLVGPQGRVVAVEPLSDLAQWLHVTSRTLGARWVTVAQVALSAHSGDGSISVPRRWGLPVHGRSYLIDGSVDAGANREFRSANTLRVQMRTLDELCDELAVESVDFVKMDVEGAELAVLAGAERVLQTRPMMMLEIEGRHLLRYGRRVSDVVAFFQDRNYAMYAWIDEAWRCVDGPRLGLRNYLFCHRAAVRHNLPTSARAYR